MTKVAYFLLCENLIKDDEDRITIVNIFSGVKSTEAIAKPTKFVIAIGITPPKEDLPSNKLKMRVEILHKTEVIAKFETREIEIPVSKLGGAVVAPLDVSGNISFNKEGEHTAKLYVNNKVYATTHFVVNLNTNNGGSI